MTKIRGFELVSTYNNQDLLPKRETAHAAGYDLKVAENTVIAPGDIVPKIHLDQLSICLTQIIHSSLELWILFKMRV